MAAVTLTFEVPDNLSLNIDELKAQFQGIINLFAKQKKSSSEVLSSFEISKQQAENGELYVAKDLDDLFKQLKK